MRIHSELPIFRIDGDSNSAVYTPGFLTVIPNDQIERISDYISSLEAPDGGADQSDVIKDIFQHSNQAQEQWKNITHRAYEPECLTIYLSNCCNLKCEYCFSASETDSTLPANYRMKKEMLLSAEAIEQAAKLVAQYCKQKNKRFTLVVHGGGEPTLHGNLLEQVCQLTKQVADQYDLSWWGYIATNGVMSESQAIWLTETFDYIGLSCDGPAIIQDRQRPKWNGKSTSEHVERSADIFRQLAAEFSVRATITEGSVLNQIEIVEYIIHTLGCADIRFEPVYLVEPTKVLKNDAAIFVDNFLLAQQYAEKEGCQLQLSGVRLGEIHGPYCNVLRGVLQLTPDGDYSNCFVSIGNDAGHFVEKNRMLPKFEEYQENAMLTPTACKDCINVMHCSRDCPDVCYADRDSKIGGYRCQMHRRYTNNVLTGLIESHSGTEITQYSL